MTDIELYGERQPTGDGVHYYCHDCKKDVSNFAHKCNTSIKRSDD